MCNLNDLYSAQAENYKARRQWHERAQSHLRRTGQMLPLFPFVNWAAVLPADLLAEGQRIREDGDRIRAAGRALLARGSAA